MWRDRCSSPLFGSISARTSVSLPYRERAALAIASSMAPSTILRSMAFSRATASAICNSSSLLALTVAIGGLLALVLFALAQRFGNQGIGENELGFRHVIDTQQNVVRCLTTD